MKRAEHIQNELNELGAGVLMSLPSTMPYAFSVNQFEAFRSDLMESISFEGQVETRPSWPGAMPFEAPDASYFNQLGQVIMEKALNSEPGWSKSNPYTVPTGYFEAFADQVLVKAKGKPAARKRIPLFHTVRLAAAMALIFFVGFGLMRMNQPANPAAGLQNISQAEIAQYVNDNLDDFDTDLILNTLAKNDVKSGRPLEISDAEIKAYLDETGWN